MSGGGGDDPPPSSPLNSGEFLLKLLRNPPQQPPRQQAPQPAGQNLPHDPAVAAVGPSISFPTPLYQSNGPSGHEHLSHRSPWSHSPAHFAPHNFFLQNPNPNLSSVSPPRPGFDQNYQKNYQLNQSNLFGGDDVRKVGPFGTNPKLNSAHQLVQTNLMFGSLPSDIHNNARVSSSNSDRLRSDDRGVGLGNRFQNGLENEFQKSLELNRNKELNAHAFGDQGGAGGSNRWAATPVRRPPPGFSGNPRNVGNKSGTFARNRNKGKGKFAELNHRNVTSVTEEEKERATGGRMSGERRLTGQLDSPGPPTGSNLHSVTASEFEESPSELHGEVRGDRMRREGDQFQIVLEDLDEQVMGTLVLDDESAEKVDKKKRDKDYRSDKRGQRMLPQRTRFFRRQIECRSDINQLNTAFLTIYESLIPSEEEKAKQKQLLALLEKHVTKEWPKARLYLYGSCANSFGFRKSDIDVCLAIEDADVNKSEVLLKLADILQSDNLQNVQALTRARVPIVKLKDPVTGISCDICVNNLLAVINTKLLQDYAHIDARLRQLAFIVKHWAKLRGVNETYQGTLSSYAYVLMCIHFLQQRTPAILPCLQGMERTYAVNVDNTECAYFDQVDKLCGFGSRNKESIAQLVWAFFSYWAYHHNYPNEVISVRTGNILSKREKEWTTRIGNDRHLICIEDPFEISHDLGRVVDKHSIRVLREEFERAADIMQNDSDPCVTLFKPYVPS